MGNILLANEVTRAKDDKQEKEVRPEDVESVLLLRQLRHQ